MFLHHFDFLFGASLFSSSALTTFSSFTTANDFTSRNCTNSGQINIFKKCFTSFRVSWIKSPSHESNSLVAKGTIQSLSDKLDNFVLKFFFSYNIWTRISSEIASKTLNAFSFVRYSLLTLLRDIIRRSQSMQVKSHKVCRSKPWHSTKWN